MEVLTIHLPKLGVELLPLQFKQLKEKEEVIQMALAAHAQVGFTDQSFPPSLLLLLLLF
jgi:hypothetical protein